MLSPKWQTNEMVFNQQSARKMWSFATKLMAERQTMNSHSPYLERGWLGASEYLYCSRIRSWDAKLENGRNQDSWLNSPCPGRINVEPGPRRKKDTEIWILMSKLRQTSRSKSHGIAEGRMITFCAILSVLNYSIRWITTHYYAFPWLMHKSLHTHANSQWEEEREPRRRRRSSRSRMSIFNAPEPITDDRLNVWTAIEHDLLRWLV